MRRRRRSGGGSVGSILGSTPRQRLTANQQDVETDAAGFTVYAASCTILRVTTHKNTGLASIELTSNATVNSTVDLWDGTNRIPVPASTKHTFTAHVNCVTASRDCQVGIDWYTSGGSYISNNVQFAAAQPLGAWSKIEVTATSPSSAAYGVPWIQVRGVVSGDKYCWDTMSFIG